MITAAHRVTKKTQEVLATGNGELLTFPAVAKTRALTDTATIDGPLYFVGMTIACGGEPAQMSVTSGEDTIFVQKVDDVGATSAQVLPYPIYCPNGITCWKTLGTGATFIVYYIEG